MRQQREEEERQRQALPFALLPTLALHYTTEPSRQAELSRLAWQRAQKRVQAAKARKSASGVLLARYRRFYLFCLVLRPCAYCSVRLLRPNLYIAFCNGVQVALVSAASHPQSESKADAGLSRASSYCFHTVRPLPPLLLQWPCRAMILCVTGGFVFVLVYSRA